MSQRSRFTAGLSALVIGVPEAEPVVGPARARHDPSVAYGVGPHVSVMYPFLPASNVNPDVRGTLATMFGESTAFEATFAACGRFPGLVYLAAEPVDRFDALTGAVISRWPDLVPYQGKYGKPTPHLSVAFTEDPAVGEAVRAELEPGLPLRVRVSTVDLVVFDGSRWNPSDSFPLAD
ncbi:2'-5' RNA ligase family protein [Stackebrandtia nassauensis]|uniref:2'-5' RNA ligase family protein n=1 Tax=Stackebrandtia nassauensis (strain DSM 44728 / CIP 108903 / NRRL B-16338 / NBRC 102104 / LLR-40K-21) TaxID=446470 RepID=D3Q0T5_STANL|nr:2'-5' RNA ligase family protein [Stackebrandtia nassauensis]ADD43685.1 conserved hypothetical protein [Stackebrandtia nassauensis DSM 44728]